MTPSDHLMSIMDIAAFTGLSDHTIRRAIKDCELPATLLRGRYRVAERDLVAWVDAGRVTPTPPGGGALPFVAPPPPPRRSSLSHRERARQMRRDRAA